MPTHKRYESREVKKRSKKKHSDHDHKGRFELEEDDHFSHLFESDNHFEDESKEDAVIDQDTDAFSFIDQDSDELIWIKDSCDIDVTTRDTQDATQVQLLLQTVVFVLTILLAEEGKGQVIAQELFAAANIDQVNKQKIIIVNSKDVTITTTDSDTALNVQIVAQTLVSVLSILLFVNV